MIFFFWDTNGSPPLSLITNHFRFFNFLLLRVGDLLPRTLSLSLEDASLSWLFVLARVHVFQHLFFIFSCLCVCVVCILFQIKTSSLKALSLSLAFFGSLMLSADDDDDQNGDDRAATATREEGGELVVVLERRQLVYVETWFFKIWRSAMQIKNVSLLFLTFCSSSSQVL